MSRSILFIEDNANTALAMKTMLELKGHAVTAVGRVSEAKAALESGAYDVIISDLNLPDGSGTEIVTSTELPAIALSGNVAPEEREKALNSGFREYITKPFEFDNLLRAIEEACA